MRELAFVGLSDDGTALVLSGPDGTRYTVPCDDKLEAAMRRDRTRLGQMEIALDGTTPKDIQQRVRFGQTPEEISDSSGIPLERVLRFAGPVIAERQHIAAQAVEVELRDGSTSRTLGSTVIDTLALGGADPELIEWDAWRREDGRWSLLASWEPRRGRSRTAPPQPSGPSTRSAARSSPTTPRAAGCSATGPRSTPRPTTPTRRPHLVGLPSHDELDTWDDDSVDPDAAFTAIVERDSGAEILDLADRPPAEPDDDAPLDDLYDTLPGLARPEGKVSRRARRKAARQTPAPGGRRGEGRQVARHRAELGRDPVRHPQPRELTAPASAAPDQPRSGPVATGRDGSETHSDHEPA